MASINDPFRAVDFSDMPEVSRYEAPDGQRLAYREYDPVGVQIGSVTLIHGSSASSNSMHPLAKALSSAGYRVFSLDARGHGASGVKGHIDYVGQLDSDLAAFVRVVRPPQPSTLAGFSAGGGFALRFAGGKNQALFGSYLLLSPFLSQDAPNQRPDSGGWVNVGIPRVIALSVLNAAGIHRLNWLSVTAFALNDQARAFLTPEYDYNLAMNFRPEPDYMANIRSAERPCAVLAGAEDEAFRTEMLEETFRSAGKDWAVELLPNVGHIALTLEAAALAATVRVVRDLQRADEALTRKRS
jgi:pimeloyl-ACP methyl ester carboxylesterase